MWLQAQSTPPAGFDHTAAGRLADLTGRGHFWLRERERLLQNLILHRVRPASGPVLELGCGTGSLLPFLQSRFAQVVGVDGHRRLLASARTRDAHAVLIEADILAPPLAPNGFDLILALDVIEHVDPDALLASSRRLVKPGGRLLLSAPAFPALWSAMDVLAGHRCRYRLRQMQAELSRNGWRMLGHTHYQCLMFPAMLLSRRLFRGASSSLERRPPRWLDRLFGAVNRIETGPLSRITLPFGSSLVAWAEPV